MGKGSFESDAPKGPVIGPMKNYDELSEAKKAEIGDPRIFHPVAVDPRVVAEEQARAQDLPGPDETQKLDRTPEQVADELEALHSVIEEEQGRPEEEVVDDAEDIAITEEAKPVEEDKREFIRCIMSGEQYGKTYPVCGGVLRVFMRDPWPQDQEAIYSQLAKDVSDGAIKSQDDWETWHDRYQLVQNMGSVQVAPSGKLTHTTHSEDLRADFKAAMDNSRGTAGYQILMKIGRVFRRHIELLVDRALDSDFWTDVGLVSPSEPASTERLTTDIPVARTGS